MTGIANAPVFTGFGDQGGDDFSLDLAGPDAGGDAVASIGTTDEVCRDFAQDMLKKSTMLQRHLDAAELYESQGHPQAARIALVEARDLAQNLQDDCNLYFQACRDNPSVTKDDQLRIAMMCNAYSSIEAQIDSKLAELNTGTPIDLRPIGEALWGILRFVGGIGRALGGGAAWQN
ncbi:hypothetical protein [Futiania mangrovi]|uniref:Uncharacterized protein n=1 Tax=Futiania mangrovi TaxID=2959716 RepID=A0A9J6PBN1_9PROT|nr:hypothetical protein [Futiania mangrovii]MCP1337556.1 hypothetical protein [Futiania mangrovii]